MNALKGLKRINKENESVSETSYDNPVFQNDKFIEWFSSLIQPNDEIAQLILEHMQHQAILPNKQKKLVSSTYLALLLKHF